VTIREKEVKNIQFYPVKSNDTMLPTHSKGEDCGDETSLSESEDENCMSDGEGKSSREDTNRSETSREDSSTGSDAEALEF
jgi:hypothetical protein